MPAATDGCGPAHQLLRGEGAGEGVGAPSPRPRGGARGPCASTRSAPRTQLGRDATAAVADEVVAALGADLDDLADRARVRRPACRPSGRGASTPRARKRRRRGRPRPSASGTCWRCRHTRTSMRPSVVTALPHRCPPGPVGRRSRSATMPSGLDPRLPVLVGVGQLNRPHRPGRRRRSSRSSSWPRRCAAPRPTAAAPGLLAGRRLAPHHQRAVVALPRPGARRWPTGWALTPAAPRLHRRWAATSCGVVVTRAAARDPGRRARRGAASAAARPPARGRGCASDGARARLDGAGRRRARRPTGSASTGRSCTTVESRAGACSCPCRSTRCSRWRSGPGSASASTSTASASAGLWSAFSEVAATNPNAWIQQPLHRRRDRRAGRRQPDDLVPVHEAHVLEQPASTRALGSSCARSRRPSALGVPP